MSSTPFLKSRLQYIPDKRIGHIAGVSEHQSRSVAVETGIVPVHVEPRHYLQLKAFLDRYIKADILRGRTVFPHYPRLYLKGDP